MVGETGNIRELEILIAIVSRKTDFLTSLLTNKSINIEGRTALEGEKIRDRFTEIIAEIDPYLFLTANEKRNQSIDPSTILDDLDLCAIWQAIDKRIWG